MSSRKYQDICDICPWRNLAGLRFLLHSSLICSSTESQKLFGDTTHLNPAHLLKLMLRRVSIVDNHSNILWIYRSEQYVATEISFRLCQRRAHFDVSQFTNRIYFSVNAWYKNKKLKRIRYLCITQCYSSGEGTVLLEIDRAPSPAAGFYPVCIIRNQFRNK